MPIPKHAYHVPSEAEVARLLAIPTPPPSPLTPLSSLLPQIPSPPSSPLLPPVDRREEVPEAMFDIRTSDVFLTTAFSLTHHFLKTSLIPCWELWTSTKLASQMAPIESPQMVSTVKLPILKKVPPKTAQALLQRQRERKAKSILLLAIPDEYQLRFHSIKDAKSLWAAIKSRFGGNVKSKKMHKNVLKQQFENFFVSDTEGLDKAYDRFQKLISLLEVHGAAVSNEDAIQKNLRALPLSGNNVALIMRNKDGIDDLDIDDLYNNLKVFEADIKGFDKTKVECFNCHRRGHFARECRAPRNQGNRKRDAGYRRVIQDNALIVQDGLGYVWSYIAQDEPTEFALMAYTANSSGSDIKVQSCSKNCVKTYEKLQKQFDEQRQTLSKANLEIVAYQLGLESVEKQLVVHQKNEVVYEEKITVLEFEVKEKDNAFIRLKKQLDETLRENDELKAKLE
ncbi:ribonuclease H-like domain-containing protein [Tanacetum coccineum]